MTKSKPPDKQNKFCKLALELGVQEAKIIPSKKVVTAEWVRLKCQYGCGSYGECYTCPPYSPTPEITRKVLDSYNWAILLHANEKINMRKIGAELERQIFLSGYYKAFAFVCGPCNLCSNCTLKKGCTHPYQARPSMEASGIDVFSTVRGLGMPLEVVTSDECKQNRYALVLIE